LEKLRSYIKSQKVKVIILIPLEVSAIKMAFFILAHLPWNVLIFIG